MSSLKINSYKVCFLGFGRLAQKIHKQLDVASICVARTKADFSFDILNPSYPAKFLKELSSITHLVIGLSPRGLPMNPMDAYEYAYVRTAETFFKQTKHAFQSLQKVIYFSSTGVYPPSDTLQTEDDCPLQQPIALQDKQSILQMAESLWDDFSRFYQADLCILRFSGIYGFVPPDQERIVQEIANGRAYLTKDPYFTNRIHAEDAALFAHNAIFSLSGIYNVTDNLPSEKNEVILYLCKIFSLPVPREIRKMPHRGKKISNKKLRNTGFKLQYPSYQNHFVNGKR
ncbi:MAG: hypothetical protein D6767_06550 [Candidatus Hydrogenedentota bacterium]|nr:MAG: hypothetical protein D6767_06550 [Candidatus Hydrogenedentota bacterium]